MANCGCGGTAGPLLGSAIPANGASGTGGPTAAAGYFSGLKPLCKKCFAFWVLAAVIVVIIYTSTRKG